MSQKPILVILAAGMGSRYGRLKQMDPFGPNGETIIDYSIYDAIRAGFGHVVFVVRDSFLQEFKDLMDPKFGDRIKLSYVTQELSDIPEGVQVHPQRQKPWGTAHAVWAAREVVDGPFAVINADDFYGRDAYRVLETYLTKENNNHYAIVAYSLKNTLSEHGSVNRGVCYLDDKGNLEKVVERIKIQRGDDGVVRYETGDCCEDNTLSEDTLVSMNMLAFQPSYFEYTGRLFKEFLEDHGMEEKSEFFIPLVIDTLIRRKVLSVDVLRTDSSWFGVTYMEDKPIVMKKLNQLIEKGEYPEKLY